MRPRAINVGRYAPLKESGFLRTRQRAYPLAVGWVERLAESHQFRFEDLFSTLALAELAANDPEGFDAMMWAELLRDEAAGTEDPFSEEER